MSNLQDWSKQFRQFEQLNFSDKQNKTKNQKNKTNTWSTYRTSPSSQSNWSTRQRDPVKELTDIAECRKRHGNDMDPWRFKESKSHFKSGVPGSSSGMSGSFSKVEKKSSAKKWIIIAIVIIFLLNVGIGFIGTLFYSIRENFSDAIQAVELELMSEPEPAMEVQAPVGSTVGENDGSYERDEDSVFTLKNVTGMDDEQASDFMDIFEACTMGVLWDMYPMSKFDEPGLTCYAVYPLWEDGWDEETDMMVWLDADLAIARLEFLGNTLYDVNQGVITNTTQILFFHDDLTLDTVSWGERDGVGFISGVISQTSDRDYAYVAPIVAFYDQNGEFLDAYYVDAKRDVNNDWIFSTGITGVDLPWDEVAAQVEGILAY